MRVRDWIVVGMMVIGLPMAMFLGMCGIGIDTSVASADEVLNAIKQQEGMSLISDAQYNTLMKCIPNHNQTVENVCNFFKVKDLRELTVKHFMILMNKMGEQ